MMKKSVSLWLPMFKAINNGEVSSQEKVDPVEVSLTVFSHF
jgi:hypothetical protein